MASDAIPESWRPVLEPALAAPEVDEEDDAGMEIDPEGGGPPEHVVRALRTSARRNRGARQSVRFDEME